MVRALPLSRKGTRASGVTLLEILVAVAVLAVGLSTIFQIFPMGFAASAKSSAQTTAYELAARKLEDVRNNHLFGGVPNSASSLSTDWWKYWGRRDAPNPDDATYSEVNTGGHFRAFSADQAPERSFFYRVHCVPVVDPPHPGDPNSISKYMEFPYALEDPPVNWRGFASMYRVTVTVRGPLKAREEAEDAQWENSLAQKGAVEAKLITYVANKGLGDALLAEDPNDPNKALSGYKEGTKPIREGALPDGSPAPGADYVHIVGLDGGYPFPENFTVFRHFVNPVDGAPRRVSLSLYEFEDTGPTVVVAGEVKRREEYLTNVSYTKRLNGLGQNLTGLDNVVIFCDTEDGGFIAESNKVIAIHPPGTFFSPPAYPYTYTSTLWRLDLLNPLIISDGDFPLRKDDSLRRSPLLDETTDLETENNEFQNGNNGKFGYPVGQVSGGSITGTRVRFLMRLEEWP
jgi:type II secretory pathway pseudopilin PulG